MTENVVRFERNPWRLREIYRHRPRIRRDSSLPHSLQHALATGQKYRRSLGEIAPGFELRYWQCRRWRLDESTDPDVPAAWHRETIAWLLNDKRERVAGFELVEFEVAMLSNYEIVDQLDSLSELDSRFGPVLAQWEDFGWEVAPYGSVLDVRTVWQSRRHTNEHTLAALNALVALREPHAAAVFVLPYPLEYEGMMDTETSHLRVPSARRTRALGRVAERRLGVRLMPGPAGADGWMWRPARGLELPQPGDVPAVE